MGSHVDGKSLYAANSPQAAAQPLPQQVITLSLVLMPAVAYNEARFSGALLCGYSRQSQIDVGEIRQVHGARDVAGALPPKVSIGSPLNSSGVRQSTSTVSNSLARQPCLLSTALVPSADDVRAAWRMSAKCCQKET